MVLYDAVGLLAACDAALPRAASATAAPPRVHTASWLVSGIGRYGHVALAGGVGTAFRDWIRGVRACLDQLPQLPGQVPVSFFSSHREEETTMTPSQVQFSGPYGGAPFGGDAEPAGAFPAGFNFARRTSVSAESMSPQLSETRTRAAHTQAPKSEDQQQRIRAATSDIFLFRNLEPEQYQAALQAMEEVHQQAGDIVIKQGDQGDYLYIVESGSLDVFIQPPGTSPADALAAPPDQLGNKVVTYGPGASFGELALLYMQPRAASVVATAPCTLWAVDRVTFRSILAEANMSRRAFFSSFLKQVPLLQHLNDTERLRVLDAIEIQDYNPGDVIVREGDIGTHFYMVVNGVADVHKASDSDAPVTKLQRGDYFGELALMHSAPRAATVSASAQSGATKLRVAALEEQAFTRLLGPLTGIMSRYAETHYKNADAEPSTPSTLAPPAGSDSAAPMPGSPRSGAS